MHSMFTFIKHLKLFVIKVAELTWSLANRCTEECAVCIVPASLCRLTLGNTCTLFKPLSIIRFTKNPLRVIPFCSVCPGPAFSSTDPEGCCCQRVEKVIFVNVMNAGKVGVFIKGSAVCLCSSKCHNLRKVQVVKASDFNPIDYFQTEQKIN
jgi:hypothetical protein